MIEIAVNNLAAATGARTVTGEADRVCRGCVIDSRQVEEGTIFVAFPGEKVDGNDFASRAIESGAGAVVMTREPMPSCFRWPMRRAAPSCIPMTPRSFCCAWLTLIVWSLAAW